MTVDRAGIIDLLVKTQQTLRITAEFMHSLHMNRDSIVAEVLGAYIEALAAALERDIDEALVAQLVPLIKGLGEALGDDDTEEQGKVLKEQTDEFIKIIKQSRGLDQDEPLEIVIDTEVIH